MAVKKTTKKKKKKKVAPPDIRSALPPTPANLTAVLGSVRDALQNVPVPETPVPGSLVEVMLHITMAQGIRCGIGQECRRRFVEGFVDRNEFRLTEGFEIEDSVADLEIPQAFQRCLRARDSIAEVYNDQNQVDLEFLREAPVTDRNMFFQRMPVLKPDVIHFLQGVMTFEEIIFSDKSTLRLQQRVGLDPKASTTHEFLGQLNQMIRPYGHLPLDVGPHAADGSPILTPELSAASELVRLAPPRKGK